MKFTFGLSLLAIVACLASAETIPIHKLGDGDRQLQIDRDLLGVQTYRQGLDGVIVFMNSRPDLFPFEKLQKARMLSREPKEAVWSVWKTFLDYIIALDSLIF